MGTLSILIVLALIFTRSRGGQVVLAVQLLCILIYLVQKKDHSKVRDFFIGLGLITALYFGLIYLIKLSEVNQFYSTPPSIVDAFTGKLGAWDNLVNRLVYWKTGWEIYKDYWLTGSGPWTFELLFPLYLTSEGFCLPLLTPLPSDTLGTCQMQGASGLVNGFVYSVNPPHSHNFIIQTATETGVIGLGIFIIFLIAIYSRGINLLRNSPPETRSFVFFLLLSVTGFMIHNQIEYNWIQIHFIYPFIFLVFALDFMDRKYSLKKSSLKKVNSLIQSSVLTAFILVGTLSTVSYYKYQALIYEKIIPGTGVANIRMLTNKVKTYCPGCGWPGLEMTKNLISQYRLTPNHTILESAETELKEVALLTPFNLRQFIYLAEIRSFQKKWDGAKKFYDQAFKNIKMKQLHACRVILSNPDKC